MAFIDNYNRQITYLRISLTDRCNFRCVYCMPEEDVEWIPRDEILSFEELELIVGVFAKHGTTRIRLTGGEPLLRRDIGRLIQGIRGQGIDEVALTTNAFLLPKLATELKEAGLTHLNVSLDSLDPKVFNIISRNVHRDRVLEGLKAAKKAGFENIKLNTVIIRGVNDHEILNLVNFAAKEQHLLRFIEFMPVGSGTIWDKATGSIEGTRSFPVAEIRQKLSERGHLQRENKTYGKGPAQYWKFEIPGATPVSLGFISALSSCFCDDCNRLRITPTGGLRACLADDREENLRLAIRSVTRVEEKRKAVENTVLAALDNKKQKHNFDINKGTVTIKRMHAIGG